MRPFHFGFPGSGGSDFDDQGYRDPARDQNAVPRPSWTNRVNAALNIRTPLSDASGSASERGADPREKTEKDYSSSSMAPIITTFPSAAV